MYHSIRCFFLFLLVTCVMPVTSFASGKLPVFVTIVPQKYFVQQIGKDLVDVQVMVEPGASPHTYEPKPQQMVAISKAKIYFGIGVEFEKAHLDKIVATNPKLKVIHTDHGIEKLAMEAHHNHEDHEDKHHDADHDHEMDKHHGTKEHHENHQQQAGLDPHIWLSPSLVKIQAQTILAALQEADPAHKSVYETNFQEFAAQIDQLDADLKKIFAGKPGLQFLVFHPAWGYFAHDYGLQQVPIEIEGKSPKPAQLKELVQHARESGINIIFVQPQFSVKDAEVVAKEIGGQVVFANPLAEDWTANLRQVAAKFQAALK